MGVFLPNMETFIDNSRFEGCCHKKTNKNCSKSNKPKLPPDPCSRKPSMLQLGYTNIKTRTYTTSMLTVSHPDYYFLFHNLNYTLCKVTGYGVYQTNQRGRTATSWSHVFTREIAFRVAGTPRAANALRIRSFYCFYLYCVGRNWNVIVCACEIVNLHYFPSQSVFSLVVEISK